MNDTTPPARHTGSCHCGVVRYSVDLDLSRPIISCNCSICSKTGSLLAFVPAGQFELLSGGERLVDYQFARKMIHHYFCPVCGVRSFAAGTGPDGQDMRAINVRCLDDVDLAALTLQPFDGKHLI